MTDSAKNTEGSEPKEDYLEIIRQYAEDCDDEKVVMWADFAKQQAKEVEAELQSLREQLEAKDKGWSDALGKWRMTISVMENQSSEIQQLKEALAAKEKSTATLIKHGKSENESLREQLKQKDNVYYRMLERYASDLERDAKRIAELKEQLKQKEEVFSQMRTTFHDMNKNLMDDIITKNTEIAELKEALRDIFTTLDSDDKVITQYLPEGESSWKPGNWLDKARKLLNK